MRHICSYPEQDISDSDKLVNYKDMEQDEYLLPLPRPVDVNDALPVVLNQMSILSKIERNSKNKVKICLSGKELETSFKHDDQLAVVMHIEGAECIDKIFIISKLYFELVLDQLGQFGQDLLFLQRVFLCFSNFTRYWRWFNRNRNRTNKKL